MSAPSSLVAIAQNQPTDPVDSRFNKLAKKILDELGQASYARDFFASLDQILLEPSQRTFQMGHLQQVDRPSRLRLRALAKKQRQLELGLGQVVSQLSSQMSSQMSTQLNNQLNNQVGGAASGPLRKSDLGNSPQRPTSKFASLPVEVAPTSQTREGRPQVVPNGNSCKSKQSAIPVSKQSAYPINRSATVGDTYNLSRRGQANASRGPTRVTATTNTTASNQTKARAGQQVSHSKLSAGEKINQRRPTRAKLDQEDIEFLTDNSRANSEAEDLDDEHSDDSSTSSEADSSFAKLAARRAYLGEKFIRQQHKEAQVREQQQQQQKQQQSSRPLQEISQVQRQKQKFSQQPQRPQVVKSNSNVHLSSTATYSTNATSPSSQQQPRSLGNPSLAASRNSSPISQSIELSSKETLGHLYKPHMNYSTSLLGNHRLSDDDEIIIIPTASPSSLVTSSCCSPADGAVTTATTTNHNNNANMSEPPEDERELSERFSISRTKSFWERLSNTTTGSTAPNAKQASFEQNWTDGQDSNNNNNNNTNYQDLYGTSTA